MDKPTRDEMKAFIASIGGEEAVCGRLRVSLRTLHSHYDNRAFAAKWLKGLVLLAREHDVPEPPLSFFHMLDPIPANAVGEVDPARAGKAA